MSYSDQGVSVYQFLDVALSADAGNIERIVGPSGKQGRIDWATAVITAAVDVATTNINFGTTSGVTAAELGTMAVTTGGSVGDLVSVSSWTASAIAADTRVFINIDETGANTAGTADITVGVVWW